MNSKTLENTAFNLATNTAVIYGLNQSGVGASVAGVFPTGPFGSAMAASGIIETVKLAKMGLGELGVMSKQPVRGLDEVAIDFTAQTGALYGLDMFGFSDQLEQFFPDGPVGVAMQGSVVVEAVDLIIGFAKQKGLLSKAENAISGLF